MKKPKDKKEKKKIHVCSRCGEKSYDCLFTHDPYAKEIWDRLTKDSWWCQECHRKALDNI